MLSKPKIIGKKRVTEAFELFLFFDDNAARFLAGLNDNFFV